MNVNRLKGRPRSAVVSTKYPKFDQVARNDREEWEELIREWGELNELKLSMAPFGPRKLAGAGKPDDTSTLWPGRDHESYFRRDRRRAAIVTEPYDSEGIRQAVLDYISPLGLVLHVPPEPRASLWYPGYTLFLVITKPDFGDIRWLPEQLEFDGVPFGGAIDKTSGASQ